MSRYLIIFALLLTGCDERVRIVYTVPYVPADFRKPVEVRCPSSGSTMARAGVCLERLNAGVNRANIQIAAIDEILTKAESQQIEE